VGGFGFADLYRFLERLQEDANAFDEDVDFDAVKRFYREEAARNPTISTCVGTFSVVFDPTVRAGLFGIPKGELLKLVASDGRVVVEYDHLVEDVLSYLLAKRVVPMEFWADSEEVHVTLHGLCGSDVYQKRISVVRGRRKSLFGGIEITDGSASVLFDVDESEGMAYLVLPDYPTGYCEVGFPYGGESVEELVSKVLVTFQRMASVYKEVREELAQVLSTR